MLGPLPSLQGQSPQGEDAEAQEGSPPGDTGNAAPRAPPTSPAPPAHNGIPALPPLAAFEPAPIDAEQKLELYKGLLKKSGYKPNWLRQYCAILEFICDCLQDQTVPDKAALLERVVSLCTGNGLQAHPEDIKTCIQFIFGQKLFLLQKDEHGVVTSMGMKKHVTKDNLRRKLIRTLYAALLEEGEADGWRGFIDEALQEQAAEPGPLSS